MTRHALMRFRMADTAWTAADFGGDEKLFRMINILLNCVVNDHRSTQENLGRCHSAAQAEAVRHVLLNLPYEDTYNRACVTILECSESSDTFPSPEEWKRWDAAAQAIREFEQD